MKDIDLQTHKNLFDQQLTTQNNEMFAPTISLDSTLQCNSQITLMSEEREQDEFSNFLHVTDVTEMSCSPAADINVIPASLSTSVELKTLEVKSLPHGRIRVIKTNSPTDLLDLEKNSTKIKESMIEVRNGGCSVKRIQVNKAPVTAHISRLASIDLNNKKLNNMWVASWNNITRGVKSPDTPQLIGDDDQPLDSLEAANMSELENISDSLVLSTDEPQVSVDETSSSTEICLQVTCNDTQHLSNQEHSPLQISPISPIAAVTTTCETSLDQCMSTRGNSTPENGHVAGESNINGAKVFIRTDSVTVRRRVSKKSKTLTLSAKNALTENNVLNAVHSDSSPDVKDSKFIITNDAFSQVSITNKAKVITNPETYAESGQCLESKEEPAKESACKKRQRCKEGGLSGCKKKKMNNDIVCCAYCDSYGILLESIKSHDDYFCSEDCLMEFQEEKNRTNEGIERCGENLLNDLTPTECVPAVPFPWGDGVTSFFWDLYLKYVSQISPEVIAAPANLWNVPYPPMENPFKIGMKLESIDPFHQSLFCVATVQNIIGYRVRIHFDGYSSLYDFWCNADSSLLFPMDWCREHNHVLKSPPKFLNFTWEAYLDHCKLQRPSTTSKFGPDINSNASNFEIGMKLEAEDRKNWLICVATVADVIGNRILVTFDGWESSYDAWFDVTSPFIHPVGWAQKNDMDLCAPNGYKNPECFNWMEYLKKMSARAVPAKAFVARQPIPFKKGMKVEVVDKRNPTILRVATIVGVDGYKIKIHFDGWDDFYDYWLDDDSPDIHPPFWSERTGHPLQPPLTQEQCALDVDSGMGCGTPGCKGIGHSQGLIYDNHHTIHGCPYSIQNLNIDLENYHMDRLKSIPMKKLGSKTVIDLERNSSSSVEDDSQPKRVRKRRRFFDEIDDVQAAKCSKIDEIPRKSPVSKSKTAKPINLVSQSKIANTMSQSKINLVTQCKSTNIVTPSKPINLVTKGKPTNPVTQGKPTNSVTQSNPTNSVTQSNPTSSVTQSNPTNSVTQSNQTNSVIQSKPTDPVSQSKSATRSKKAHPIAQSKNTLSQPMKASEAKIENMTPVSQNEMNDFSKTENISSTSHETVFNAACVNPLNETLCLKEILSNYGLTILNYKNICALSPTDIKNIVEKIERCGPWGNKFVEQDIDGISFIRLQQSDLTNVLKITLGPSKKIMLCVEHMRLACSS